MRKSSIQANQRLFIKLLANAVEFDLPLEKTMRTFKPWPALTSSWGKITPWNRFLAMLEQGEPLGAALMTLKKFLPKLFIEAVREAEARGMLKEMLPELARKVQFDASLLIRCRAALIFGLQTLCVTLFVALGILEFIMPQLRRVFMELLMHETPDDWFWSSSWIAPLSMKFGSVEGLSVFLLMCVVLGVLSAKLFGRFLPLIGPIMTTRTRYDYARSVAAFLLAGEDLPKAREDALSLSSSHCFRWRGKHGKSLFSPFEEYLIESAVRRQCPVEGYIAVQDHLAEVLDYRIRRFAEHCEWFSVLVRSLLVGGLAIIIFRSLIAIVGRL